MLKVWAALITAFSLLLVVGCEDSTTTPDPLVVPTVYDSTGWSANTASQYQIRKDFAALISLVRSARSVSVVLTPAQTAAAFDPLRNYTIASERSRIDDLLRHTAEASGNMLDWSKTPDMAGQGGVYGSYLFDEYGRDTDEFIQKALFNVMLYNQAQLTVRTGPASPKIIDQVVALFGANPTFPNGASAATLKDEFVAVYAARRDKNDGNGFYTRFKNAALKAKAASSNTSRFQTEYNEATKDMFAQWERSQIATAINYCYSVVTRLSATTVDDAARSGAMHAFGEGAGILMGWRAVPEDQRTITNAQLDEILSLMYVANASVPECYKFWHEPVANLPRLQQVMDKLKNVYGFTSQEMEDFKSNWVAVQGR